MWGRPYSDEQRKARHLREFGSLDTFPERRLGYGDARLAYNRTKLGDNVNPLHVVAGVVAGLVVLYRLLKNK